mgnify:FL=1|jgi:hypothetical protein
MNFPDTPNTQELLKFLAGVGLILEVRKQGELPPRLHIISKEGGPVESEKGGPLTEEMISVLKRHKRELILAVIRQGYSTLSDEESEMQDIDKRIKQEGYVLLWSKQLEDYLAFHRDDLDPQSIPVGFVPYSDSEMKELFGLTNAEPSLESLKRIHDAKKTFVSSRIVSNDEDSQ